MDISIHYPYGIPFYSDMKFISVYFTNNSEDFYTIYFVENNKITSLAGIVLSKQKNKKYHFPEKSIIAIIVQSKSKEIQCYIELKENLSYIYP